MADRGRSAQKVSSRILDEKWQVYCHKLHQDRLKDMKGRTDSASPECAFLKIDKFDNPKRRQIESERQADIDLENRILYDKMLKIKNIDSNTVFKPWLSRSTFQTKPGHYYHPASGTKMVDHINHTACTSPISVHHSSKAVRVATYRENHMHEVLMHENSKLLMAIEKSKSDYAQDKNGTWTAVSAEGSRELQWGGLRKQSTSNHTYIARQSKFRGPEHARYIPIGSSPSPSPYPSPPPSPSGRPGTAVGGGDPNLNSRSAPNFNRSTLGRLSTTEASFDFGEPLSPMSPSGSVTGYLRSAPGTPKSPYLNQIGPRARIGSPRSGFRNGVSSAKGSNASSLAGSKPDSNSNSLKPQLSQGHQGQGLLTTHSSHTSAKGSRASSLAGSKPDLNSNSNPRPSSSREVSGTGALSMDPAPPPVPRSATSSPRVSSASRLPLPYIETESKPPVQAETESKPPVQAETESKPPVQAEAESEAEEEAEAELEAESEADEFEQEAVAAVEAAGEKLEDEADELEHEAVEAVGENLEDEASGVDELEDDDEEEGGAGEEAAEKLDEGGPEQAEATADEVAAEKLEEEAAAARVDKEEAGAAGDGDATEQHLYTEAEAEDVEEDIVTEAKA